MLCGNATCGDGARMSCLAGHCKCEGANSNPIEGTTCPAPAVARYCGDDTVINNYEAPPGCAPTSVHNPDKPGNPTIWCCE